MIFLLLSAGMLLRQKSAHFLIYLLEIFSSSGGKICKWYNFFLSRNLETLAVFTPCLQVQMRPMMFIISYSAEHQQHRECSTTSGNALPATSQNEAGEEQGLFLKMEGAT